MPNTNSQTIHQMGLAINAVVRQATGRDAVQNIDMDFVTVAQNKTVQVFSNSIPYMFQRTGGGMNIGNARLSSNKVIGGSLAWNQLVRNGNFSNGVTNWTVYGGTATVSDGVLTLTAERANPYIAQRVAFVTDHVFYYTVDAKQDEAGELWLTSQAGLPVIKNTTVGTWVSLSNIGKAGAIASNSYILFDPHQKAEGNKIYIKNYMCIDLTQMLGSTIADYVYSLEQATAGAGVAWFRKYFPESYYEYNAGELMSVSGLVSHDMTGFNQWDEVWENGYITDASGANAYSNVFIRSKNYIRILPDTSYYFHNGGAVSNADVYFYNANKEYLGRDTGGHQTLTNANQIFTTPSDAYYMRFYMGSAYGTTYRNNICINFSNPDLNGRYEPYQLYSYPLDSDLVLRGIPKLDSNNKLYYDGDAYEPDGTVTRRYGIVDLGSLTWTSGSATVQGQTVYYWTSTGLRDQIRKPASNGTLADFVISERYQIIRSTAAVGVVNHIGVQANGDLVCSTDMTSSTSSKPAGLFVYELATPTTDTADSFTDPQIVSPYGTEEYITTGIVPVGNETQYLELSDTNM